MAKKYKTYILLRDKFNPQLIDIFWCEYDPDQVDYPSKAGDYWMMVREYYGQVLNLPRWEDLLITGSMEINRDLRLHGIIP